ncbi:hypothetical protein NHX12_004974 [Muraenolepis orangiensis]|uniref:Uncharacterized protein n=1 Tax=Muraenolepis orangiensis TaxID=630683 RepID=A0A9Q0DW81_9TELE|nr:hypothetical protein NHX12_004974 [Muraenolepis orangiensis]
MKDDVSLWCRTCPSCAAKARLKKTPQAAMGTVRVGAPMERIAVDLMGPLNETERHNCYILVVQDYFNNSWVFRDTDAWAPAEVPPPQPDLSSSDAVIGPLHLWDPPSDAEDSAVEALEVPGSSPPATPCSSWLHDRLPQTQRPPRARPAVPY